MRFLEKIKQFCKRETVLCTASVLASLSMLMIPPDMQYTGYIDVRVLALLFSLMVVMAGLKKQGIFAASASKLLEKAGNTRQLCLLLVFLCFFSSMLITNDVALITFVPLTIIIYTMAGLRGQMMSVIIYQTIAANLGSMLTPVGNPQNLYLYSISGMELSEFTGIMLPLTAASACLLVISCMLVKRQEINELSVQKERILADRRGRYCVLFYVLLFLVSLLAVLRLIPWQVPLVLALAGAVLTDREILRQADYSLLLTFVSFFIFIGNMGRIEVVRTFLSSILTGRELLVGFLSSQLISNVPAAVLLSGFTDNWAELLKGVNIGGLGTLIASMASLISYKMYVKEEPQHKGRYLLHFTGWNLLFAAVLLVIGCR